MIYNKYEIGERVRVTKNLITVNGTLYNNSIVKIDEVGFPDKEYRVIDSTGKIWYLNKDYLSSYNS